MIARITATTDQQMIMGQEPVLLVDSQGAPTHVAMPIDEARQLLNEYLQKELQLAFDQVDAGLSRPLNIEKTIQEARRRHALENG